MFRAVPPAPVAAFGGEQRFQRLRQRRFGGRIGAVLLTRFDSSRVRLPRVPQQFPRGDVFRVADPDVEIGVDPGCRENPAVVGSVFCGGNRFAGGERAKIRIARYSLVEFAQKFATVARVIFPRIFAIEENGNRERVGALHTVSDVAKLAVQIGGGGFLVHAAVDESDEIGELVIAKQSGDSLLPAI